MNKNKLLLRLLTLPAIIALLLITYLYVFIKHIVNWLRWGGEVITLEKNENKIINDIYRILKEQYKKDKL